MGISVDGNSIVVDDCTLTINNAFDQTTGMATLTITPKGGLGTLPALMEGQPGPSAMWRNVNLTEVAYGSALPSPPASVTQISPGGPGVAAVYDLNIALHAGSPGEVGSFLISAAQDLVGTVTNAATIVWNSVTGLFEYQPQLVPAWYWPSSINSISGALTGAQELCSVTVPAQATAWNPICQGFAVVGGTANTQVQLTACIGSSSGQQVASGKGGIGATSQQVALMAAPPAGATAANVQVASGTSATIVFYATQVASTGDSWSIASADCAFSVQVSPILTSS
ncbi:hypothetical protein ACAG26_24390 [Mycobacterium sp. pUA109]|uniref:hypothetical protein n=1 Tax=Mycobacterium sp. pUA109 TaxID=3238982 RepID=UPI00351BE55F